MLDAETRSQRGAIPTVWLGEFRPEFAGALDMLCALSFVRAHAVAAWRNEPLPSNEIGPALVVVAQGIAGELGDDDIARLRRHYPTAAVVRVVGSWCEGELRSGSPPAGVRRYSASHAWPLLTSDLLRLERGERPDWGLPATSTEEEVLAAEVARRREPRVGEVHVGIASSDPTVERWLVDFCKHHEGLRSMIVDLQDDALQPWEAESDGPSVVIWDVPYSPAAAARELQRLTRSVAGTRVVALANFPRSDDLAQWREHGVCLVVGKPMSQEALLASLDLMLS